ncbi:hypothetical protein IOK49_05255 [Fervidicoccus fontis]|uniref:Uncharacterized protein n=1 Tax=Fervidicoccus fontis TaxID=683846 RepID=A0A843A844_9CREN|nr:hypothetical protein [Fervidicoccus fontis]MBE9391478.1 hypothetical protein [Fervidicoccus fontis]
MSSKVEDRLELINTYVINGIKRYVFRDMKTKIYLNVAADTEEEAKSKAKDILSKVTT